MAEGIICSKFIFYNNTCLNYIEGGCCRLPDEFLCLEYYRCHPELEIPAPPDPRSEGQVKLSEVSFTPACQADRSLLLPVPPSESITREKVATVLSQTGNSLERVAPSSALYSYSKLFSYYQSCPYSYHLRYNLGIIPKFKNLNQVIGQILHETVKAKYYNNPIIINDFRNRFALVENVEDTDLMRTSALCQAYSESVLADEIEEYPSYRFDEFKIISMKEDKSVLQGYLDIYDPEHNIFIEIKTTGKSLEKIEKWDYEDQISFYFLICPEVEWMNLLLIRKPLLKLRKGENNQEFMARTIQYIKDNQNAYFALRQYRRSEFNLPEFERRVIYLIESIRNDKTFEKRKTSAKCLIYGCDYQNYCLCNQLGDRYMKREKEIKEITDGTENVTE